MSTLKLLIIFGTNKKAKLDENVVDGEAAGQI